MARIPRGIGTSTGVKLTRTASSVRPERFWMISGVWRCVPTPYADAEPITSLPSRFGLGALPAPLVPEAATQRHLEILSEIAEMLSDRELREQLKAEPDAATLHKLIAAWEPLKSVA